jgi:dTDP-4-dehydrorhamnose 3,5-epimerase-like enzyme
MQVETTKLDGVLLIKLDVFEDFRGQYVETYNEDRTIFPFRRVMCSGACTEIAKPGSLFPAFTGAFI